MPSFRPLPVAKATHVILDNGRFPVDKEYADLGIEKGWLELYRIVNTKPGHTEMQYRYPASEECE